MGIHFKQGFTIIETMLVLAITGVMVAALLVGIGGSINAQRYKDSVNSLKSTLQDQYAAVDNVTNVNDRNDKWTCSTNGVTGQATEGGGMAPGQSDCVLLGRYVSIVNDTITTAAVVGYEKSTTDTTSDIADLKTNYALGISESSVETTTLEWGAQITWPSKGLDTAPSPVSPVPPSRAIGILVIRSPQSGSTYTFTSDKVANISETTSDDLTGMMAIGATVPGQQQRFLCVDPSPGSTGLTVPEKLSVSIGQSASDTSGIETRSDAVNSNLGQESSCN